MLDILGSRGSRLPKLRAPPHSWQACYCGCSPWLLCTPPEAWCRTPLRHPRRPSPIPCRPAATWCDNFVRASPPHILLCMWTGMPAQAASRLGIASCETLLTLPYLHDPGDTAAATRPAPGILSECALPIFRLYGFADAVLRLPDHALKLPADPALAAPTQQRLILLRHLTALQS